MCVLIDHCATEENGDPCRLAMNLGSSCSNKAVSDIVDNPDLPKYSCECLPGAVGSYFQKGTAAGSTEGATDGSTNSRNQNTTRPTCADVKECS